MDGIKAAFAAAKREGRAALVTYVTCGYPTIGETPDVLLSLQKGGADVIELGMPFSDPIADGPTIQMSNNKALDQGVNIPACLKAVRDARSRGLKVPVLFMGYYNPVLSYGEERLLKDCQEVGVNGFIMVDLPPEEAVRFRNHCRKFSLSYVPLIAPATSESRMKLLCKIADSFIYVVSRMGVTGATGSLSAGLPDLVEKVHRFSGNIPAAVGFGVSTREHFVSVGSVSEGVVIGSQIINVLTSAPPGEGPSAVEKYVAEVTGREEGKFNRPNGSTGEESRGAALEAAEEPQGLTGELPSVDKVVTDDMVPDGPGLADQLADPSKAGRIGEFGGQYVPESLMDCLRELEEGFTAAKNDPKFWEEFRSYYPYMGRPGHLQYSERLTQHAGGAKIWLKREDLNHTGSHKINNALGQILLARRLGKTEIICETGAGQHGVATATVCAKFGMKCTVYMGAEDVRRQALNVFRIKLLGAQVFAVEAGSRTLRDAVNEAMRAWVTKLSTTHYIIGSAIGPHPFPAIVREFQSVIGTETKEQMQKYRGKLPDAVVACVGGGSNAVGMFYPFANDPSVKLLGVEAGGDGVDINGKAVMSETNDHHGSQELRHSATLSGGTKGVLHGVHTYILQTPDGQVVDTYSISAGLDYPGVGPQLAAWKDDGRATYISASDAECLEGLKLLSQLEGIIPALETAHAVFGAIELAKTMDKEQDIVICLSGRGDKDVQTVAEELPRLGPKINWDLRF